MAWTLSKAEVKRCTKVLSKQFMEMEACPHDRNYRQSIASHIANELQKGTFRLANFASCYCKENGVTYRVNGKHTSNVLVGMNGSFPTDLKVLHEQYEADTLRDVASCYATFDPQKSARRRSDIHAAFAASNPDLAEVPRSIIDACARGMAYSCWEDVYTNHDAEEWAVLLLENPQFVMWVYLLLCGDAKKVKHLRRKSVIAGMFRTFQKNQKQSGEFWEMVRDESHPTNTHPTRKLSRHLLTHSSRHRDVMSSDCDSWRGMYVRCIHAWNACRSGTTTDLRYHVDAPTPVAK